LSAKKVHKEIESWIQAEIKVEDLGKLLLEGLKAEKASKDGAIPDYSVRLSYIDWICTNGRYIPEKKVAGGTFSMPAPSADSLKQVFGEERPADGE